MEAGSAKVVINKCYGGFGISARALVRYAELKGRPCFFFIRNLGDPIEHPGHPATPEEADAADMFFAYDVPNPREVLPDQSNWSAMTSEDRAASNEAYRQHSWSTGRDVERHDPDLVRVVEELGSEVASGKYGKLAIVEIPDGIEYEVDEYDGMERIDEVHRSWG